MGSFRELDLKVHYDTDNDNTAEDFYNKVLSYSIEYKRAVAFFNSSSLLNIFEGIKDFIGNEGKIKLLISPELEDKDLEAIKLGYKDREKVIEERILQVIQSEYKEFRDKYNLLAWLISSNVLDIKIIYRIDNNKGMFHDKLGLLYDRNSNIICFHGSNNETYQAMVNNFEAFNVYISWEPRDYQRITIKEHQFDSLWENENKLWKTFYISDDFKDKVSTYKITDVSPFDMNEEENEEEMSEPNLPSWLEMREYQKEAINNWFKNGGKGIFEMATGTGKTITSIAAITKLIGHYLEKKIPIALIVILPYKVLLEQWEEELQNFNIIPIKCYDSKSTWEKKVQSQISLLNSGAISHLALVTTNVTFKSKLFQEKVTDIKHDYIICIDEMHNFTSDNAIKSLPGSAKYRLGLSATLENTYKSEQMEKVKSYFGEGIIFRYPMEEAIKNGFLTKYYYYPVFVQLTDEEKDEYLEISKKIVKRLKVTNMEDESLQALFRKRARIISSAENKITKIYDFASIIKDSYFNIFYCGDKIEENEKFIEKVNKLLAFEVGIKTHTFTSMENKQARERILRDFKNQKIQALTAIKCLDEGVDIPKLKRAFILSSGSNPKEFIQRRGRVLRKAEGKDFAEIYDFMVVPTLEPSELRIMDQETLINEKKIIKKELNRFKEFANLAINTHEAYKKIFEILDLYR